MLIQIYTQYIKTVLTNVGQIDNHSLTNGKRDFWQRIGIIDKT